ncbi:hypothetical protein Q5H91_04175 [Sphingomonas sp. KR1UV-12]|uniref:DUF1983 domain-containing protein n=1 Tax=Sphingomonas aurea TaxID=3063994 RepID=A0ABT9EHF4_9SPHN|nr:hypothetical protein [Sphingomonas sp. KR1UV-12]MDP1026399.1 hypothetical protein [Sphingomonas sp. KR1UV-12]
MKVVLDTGTTVDLGQVEATPTIGIIDYSRRTTDDFGVTTVVQRGFSRRMSLRIAVPMEDVDAVQRQLVDLRAKPATWIADARYGSLSFRGFYKDFDFTVGALSLYTLTVESIASAETFVDPGTDPAASGKASSLRFLDPVVVDGSVLVSSNVPETDAPVWAASTTYAKGAQVIAAHRIYESLVAGNVGADPATTAAKWLDIGPTNRWAAFDQALGTSTIVGANVEVVLKSPAPVSGLALLDTNAATVRLRAPGYDRTLVPDSAGKALFLDFTAPAGTAVTVTATPAAVIPGPQRWDDGARWLDQRVWNDSLAAGDGTVTIGTMLIGQIKGLGVTETAPTAGIIDYSRKETDVFGEVTVVPRAWAKRMAAKALIRTDAVDLVMNRLAAARAKPCLWLGHDDLDALAVYGFYKDFDIAVAPSVSKLSLSIEGLSTAAPIKQGSLGSVAWPDVTDPAGTKPTDNADKTSENTSKDTAAVGGVPAASITGRLETLDTITIPAIEAAGAAAGQRITEARAAADLALATIEDEVERVDQRIDNLSASGGYDDTAVNTRITDERDLSLGRDAALGTRIDTVTASIATTDTNLRALVTTKEQAAVDRENAISQRVDQILAEGGGGGDADTVARAEIQRVEQAAITRDTALASRADVLEASASSSGGNFVPNSSLSTLDGWTLTFNADNLSSFFRNGAGSAWMIGGVENNLGFLRGPAGAGLCAEVQSAPFAVRPGSSLQFYGLTASHRCNVWVSVFFFDAGGNGVGYGGEHMGETVNQGGQDLNSWNRTGLQEVLVPATAVRATFVFRQYNVQNDGYGWLSRPFVTEVRPGTKTWAPYSSGNDRPVSITAAARIKTTEDTLADLPNRYATAQRATTIEASVGTAVGRIGGLERVTSDGTLVTSQRADNIEASLNDSRATVSQQAGAIVGLQGKAAAYVRLVADAGNGRAALSLWSDQYGGAWQLVGNGIISGDLTVDGSITARKFDGASMAREARSTWTGSITPAAGQTLTVPWTLTLPSIPPTGRFIYEATFVIETNEGQGFSQTINGYPAYAEYVSDGGSFFIGAFDNEGHPYLPRPNASDRVIATTDFAPTFVARVNRGTLDTGWIKDGDYYYRHIAATYTAKSIDLKATWVAI